MGGVERDENGAILERRERARGKHYIIAATNFSHGRDWRYVKVNHQSRGLGMIEGSPETAPPAHTAIPRTGRTATGPSIAIVGGGTVIFVCIASLPPLIPSLAPANNVPPTKENNKEG
jgi:hypothetical protein